MMIKNDYYLNIIFIMNIIRKMLVNVSDRSIERIENRIDGIKTCIISAFTTGCLLLWNTDKYIEMKTDKFNRELKEIRIENKEIRIENKEIKKENNLLKIEINNIKNKRWLW